MNKKTMAYYNNIEIGKLLDKYLAEVKKIHELESTEDVIKFYIERDILHRTINGEKIISELQEARRVVNSLAYETIADYINLKIVQDARGSIAVCKNCNSCLLPDCFCTYYLEPVQPFNKGCGGWINRNEEDSNIAHPFPERLV